MFRYICWATRIRITWSLILPKVQVCCTGDMRRGSLYRANDTSEAKVRGLKGLYFKLSVPKISPLCCYLRQHYISLKIFLFSWLRNFLVLLKFKLKNSTIEFLYTDDFIGGHRVRSLLWMLFELSSLSLNYLRTFNNEVSTSQSHIIRATL